MTDFKLGLIIGLFIGTVLGICISGLMIMAKERDIEVETMKQEMAMLEKEIKKREKRR